MDEERDRLTVWAFVKGLFKVVIGLSLLAQSFLFLLLLVFIFALVSNTSRTLSGTSGEGPSIQVPQGGALVLNPKGTLVEVAPQTDAFADAFAAAIGAQTDEQIPVHELVRVVRAAKDDDRIAALVLDLQDLSIPGIMGASKAHYLADVVEDFRESGKQVIAVGDYFTQGQYLIASEADTVLMHDQGTVSITGYGSYNIYFQEALEKLKVTPRIFRVGTFKSAVEPYIRSDMSPEAKEANRAFTGSLWRSYTEAVDKNRGLQNGADAYAQNFPARVDEAGGSLARAALDAGLVDQLADRPAQVAFVADIVGRDSRSDYGGFNGIGYRTYRLSAPVPDERSDADKVAIVTVAGPIVDGDVSIGAAGGDTIARQLRRARHREDVKAVVLRVDSPGGSAFASEIMRDEVLGLKAAGKPVVVSMGSVAASGGYWISANADEIWAAPTTVTGSIGVFGLATTFQDTLAEIGVYADGIGTTPLTASQITGFGPLPEAQAQIIQSSIENTYSEFLTIVADGRGLTRQSVDDVGQGRVWPGDMALQIGLVDQLGTIDDAIVAAAKRANLSEYDVVGLVRDRTPFERFLEGLTGNEADDLSGLDTGALQFQAKAAAEADTLKRLVAHAADELRLLASFNDPNAVYLRCMECGIGR